MKQPKFIQRLRYKSARKKLIPYINTSNPIIDDLVDLVIKYRYDYEQYTLCMKNGIKILKPQNQH